MKIIHICDGIYGGVGTMVRTLIKEQFESGLEPILISQTNAQIDFQNWCNANNISVKFYPMEKYRRNHLTLFGGLSRKMYEDIVKEYSEDKTIFHFHNPIACGLLGYIPSTSLCTIHGFIGQVLKRRISNIISYLTIQRLLRNQVELVGCSQAVATYLNQRYHTNQFQFVLNGLGKIKKQTNRYIPSDRKIHIGYAAKINEFKGWRILAEAYRLLPSTLRQQCDLIFVGAIVAEDKAEFNKFLHQHPEVSYLGYIREVGECVTPYLDILVLPSRSEGMPMSILEAMQHGVVPICTAVGGIPEVVEDKKSGYLIKRDATQLAQVLEQLISDPQQLVTVQEQAKQRFEQVGTAKRMSEQYNRLYQKILKERQN